MQIYTRKKLETRKMPRPAVVKKNVNKQKKKGTRGEGLKANICRTESERVLPETKEETESRPDGGEREGI